MNSDGQSNILGGRNMIEGNYLSFLQVLPKSL